MNLTHTHNTHSASHGTMLSYSVGFALSLLLTGTAFFLVEMHFWSHHVLYSHQFLYIAIIVLALSQLLAQLVFFLHLGTKSMPRWNAIVLSFALFIVLVIVGGSLWIMYNLNYNMTPMTDINTYLQSEN